MQKDRQMGTAILRSYISALVASRMMMMMKAKAITAFHNITTVDDNLSPSRSSISSNMSLHMLILWAYVWF